MRVLISTWGSRGDVEPMVGLAIALQELGSEVCLLAPPDQEFKDLLARFNLPLAPAFSSVRDWLALAKRTGMALSQLIPLMVEGQYNAIAAAAEGCDAIVATGIFPSLAAAQSVAEKFAIPFVSAHFCPRYLPSTHHAPVEFPGWPHPPEITENRALWAFNVQAMDAIFGGAVNAHRASIGLGTVENIRDHVFSHRPLLAADPVLGPWLPTDLCHAIQTGAWIAPDARPLGADLGAFLEMGAPPVYVGFGSMAMKAAPDAARTAIEAIRSQRHRILLARGWAEFGAIDDQEDCFVIGDVNQQALFGRVAAVVHHGGAGTTTTAARAGAPQLIVPQIADQPYWAGRVARLGIGVAHEGQVPTLESLSAGLRIALASKTREHAIAIASTIRTDGARRAAEVLVSAIREKR
jgi:vancomycin aglycone glucosyltransferase